MPRVKRSLYWEQAHLHGGFSSDEKPPCKWAALVTIDKHRGIDAVVVVGHLGRGDWRWLLCTRNDGEPLLAVGLAPVAWVHIPCTCTVAPCEDACVARSAIRPIDASDGGAGSP